VTLREKWHIIAEALTTVPDPAERAEELRRLVRSLVGRVAVAVGAEDMAVGAETDAEAEILQEMLETALVRATPRRQEDDAAYRQAEMAVRALSLSELRGVRELLLSMEGPEAVVVTSELADQLGMTPSVIPNGLRKLASAGVVKTRSMGSKGTYVRILNREITRLLANTAA
jgi:GTP-sensing pleiotropic transcriptional regulator CodY